MGTSPKLQCGRFWRNCCYYILVSCKLFRNALYYIYIYIYVCFPNYNATNVLVKASRPKLVQCYGRVCKTSYSEYPVHRAFPVSFGLSSLILLLGDSLVLSKATRDLCPSACHCFFVELHENNISLIDNGDDARRCTVCVYSSVPL
jgi:hypothetical protein